MVNSSGKLGTLSNAGLGRQFCKFHSVNFTALTRLQYWDVVRHIPPPHSPPSRFPSGSVRRKALCSWKRCRLLLLRRRLLVSADFMQISTANLCRAPRIHCCRSADSPGYLVRGGNGREGDSLQVATKYTKCTFHFKLIYARLSPLPSRSPVRRVSAPYAWLRPELEEKAESGAASGRDRCPAAPNSQ